MVASTRGGMGLAGRIYREVFIRGANNVRPADLARDLDITCEQVQQALIWLADHGLADPDMLTRVSTPQTAIRRLLAAQQERVKELERGNEILAVIADEFLMTPISERNKLAVEVFEDRALLRSRLADLEASNRNEALVMLPSLVDPESLQASLHEDLKLLERGIRYSLLVHVSVLRHSACLSYLTALQDARAEVRIAESLPLRLLVLDQEKVVVRSDGGKKHRDLVIHGGVLAQVFTGIFEHSWSSAMPYTCHCQQRTAAELTSKHNRVLRMMATGATDKSIGRHLGYSDRTVRRLVAEALRILETDNRFTAMVRATRLGLLDHDQGVGKVGDGRASVGLDRGLATQERRNLGLAIRAVVRTSPPGSYDAPRIVG